MSVIEGPKSQTKFSGESASFKCSIAGADVYQWLKNGHLPSSHRWLPNGEFLLFKHVTLNDNVTVVTCRGINSKTGNATEASAILTVLG